MKRMGAVETMAKSLELEFGKQMQLRQATEFRSVFNC
jgi:hypothetical protein